MLGCLSQGMRNHPHSRFMADFTPRVCSGVGACAPIDTSNITCGKGGCVCVSGEQPQRSEDGVGKLRSRGSPRAAPAVSTEHMEKILSSSTYLKKKKK